MTTIVGVLHPGVMGASVAAACLVPTVWCSEGRSPETRARAEAAGMAEAVTLGELVERCDVIVSVCPPASALDVAAAVDGAGFTGVYVDANAIAPATARQVGERFERFVDGGIVGPPAHAAGTTRLYLSGDDAAVVAELWVGSVLDARVVDGGPGAASALKACYATWTKASSAMLLAVRALARAEGVEQALLDEWAISQPGIGVRSVTTAAAVAPKAWRFIGEMEELAAAFAADRLPSGFAEAAAEVYRRIAGVDAPRGAVLDVILDAIVDPISDVDA